MAGRIPDRQEHQIRLRGPWQLSLVRPVAKGRETGIKPLGRFTAPAGLSKRLPVDYQGLARLERSFHLPTGLEPQSRIQLRIETNLAGTLSLNQTLVGTVLAGVNIYSIVQLLQTQNRLCFEAVIDDKAARGQPNCDVRLEIYHS